MTGIATVAASRVGRRWLGVLLVCALLPLLGFAGFSVRHVREQLWEDAQNSLHAAAKSAGMSLAEKLQRLEQDLQLAEREVREHSAVTSATVHPAIRERLAAGFHAVVLLDRAQAIPLHGEVPAIASVLDPAERAQLESGRTLVRAAAGRRDARLGSLQLLRGIPNGSGELALLAATVREDRFWDPETLRASGSEVFVLGSGGDCLMRTSAEAPGPQDLVGFARRVESSGTREWHLGREAHVARHWRLFLRAQYGVDWVVVQSRARAAVFAPIAGFERGFALTTFLVFLVVLALGLHQVRRMLDPIMRLHTATRALASGEYGVRARIEVADEFGDLGRSFDSMTEELLQNIRRREQIEKALVVARDAALAAAKAKQDFLSNVSHELRTPLTSILTAAEILRSYNDTDAATRLEFVGMIGAEAQRLTELIDKVLELTAQGTWVMDETRIEDSLHRALAALPRAERQRVHLLVDRQLPGVLGDAKRLERLWTSLLENALRFSDAPSPVEVHARVRGMGREIVVEVADRGIGISPEYHEAIFEPFRQVHEDVLTDKTPGAGLGLTLARHIAVRHGGRIEVESRPGAGSLFRVVLPAVVPAALAGSAAGAEESAPSPGGAAARVDPVA